MVALSGFSFFFFGSSPGSGGATVGGGATLTPTTGGGSSAGLISFFAGWDVYSLGAELADNDFADVECCIVQRHTCQENKSNGTNTTPTNIC